MRRAHVKGPIIKPDTLKPYARRVAVIDDGDELTPEWPVIEQDTLKLTACSVTVMDDCDDLMPDGPACSGARSSSMRAGWGVRPLGLHHNRGRCPGADAFRPSSSELRDIEIVAPKYQFFWPDASLATKRHRRCFGHACGYDTSEMFPSPRNRYR